MKHLRHFLAFAAVAAPFMPAAAQQRRPQQVVNGGLPAVAPNGSYIAFNARRDTTKPASVYLIRPDGTDERLLSDKPFGGVPHWMPDGSGVLVDGPNGALVAELKGSEPRPFATVVGRGFSLSPDGKWLLYSAGNFPSVRLTIASVDGTNPRPLSGESGMAFDGAWSADGKQMAFARLDSTRDMQIWLVNADGSGLRQLTHFTNADGHPQWPSWSPDGKSIAVQAGIYGQDPTKNLAHIWLIDPAAGTARKLASHDRAYLDETPSFFPDGKRIAFQSDRSGRMEVWVMDIAGTNARQVTH